MWKRIKQLFQGKPTPEPVDRKKEFSVEKYTEDQNTNTVNQEIKPNFSVGLSREESTQISDSYWQTEIENLSQALNLNPQDYVAYCDRGIIYCDMLEQYKNAVSDFTKAIEIKPDLDNLWFNRGQAYLGLKEYENAISDYAEALKINPSNSSTYNNRGHAYKEIKEYEKAIADFTQVLKLVSNNSNAYNNRGIAYGEIKEYEKAIADFTQAINLDRNFSYAYNNRGNAYRDIKEYEKAIADFTQAINLDLNFSHAYTNRGLAYDEITEYKKAIADFTQAIELDPNDCNTYSNRGLTYREIKENESAIADLTQALRLNPNDCNTYNNRGLTYCDIEEYSKAIADFTQAIQLDPKYYPAWVNKGMCFEIVRSYHVALENYDEGLSHLNSQTEPLGCAWLHWFKGRAHYNHGKTQPDARRYFALATQSYNTAYNLIEADPLHTPDTLNILKNWIIALRALGWEEDADALTLNAIQRLNNYLIQADPLYRKVLRYEVYTLKVDVDILATINSPQSHWEALQEAEKWKSLSLTWLTHPEAEANDTDPNLQNRINQLCPNPHTAILYWHLSPAQITTFLLQANQDPQVVQIIPCDPPTPEANEDQRRQRNFTDWLKHYKTLYQDNRKKDSDTPNPWQTQLPQLLDALADILQLSDLLKHLEGIQHLILVPHRDLHLLPLHGFFSEQSHLESVTYLPQLNINLPKTIQPTTPPVLIGYPTSSKPIEFACRETSLVAALYPDATAITEANVTAATFEQSLQTSAPFLHFTGHGEHNAENPEASALYLAHDEPFTLKQLLNLDSLNFPLVCLAACETGITNQGEFINEFVGFPAAFLAQGSRYILSTLWTVNEQSSMVFVVEFFRHYRQHQNPPRAFCHAQTQLQTLTYADLAQWYSHAMTEVEEFGADWSWFKSLTTNIENNPSQYENPHPPYADAYHWAGFVLTGQAQPKNPGFLKKPGFWPL